MIVSLYRKYLSPPFREKIYYSFLGAMLHSFRNFKLYLFGLRVYVFSPFFPKNDYYNAWRYIGRHGVTHYPFKTAVNYGKMSVEVFFDDEKNMPFVLHQNKQLYFPASLPEAKIKAKYRNLLIEKDINSSHRYLDTFDELKGKILLDIGAAEGIFALDAIETINKAYLFECDEMWLQALIATFAPWKEKVEIVKKYVGDSNSADCVTIDTFMTEKEHDNIHIKMDIEGEELAALNSAKNLLLKGKFISLSVCTYHRAEDVTEISAFLKSLGYACQFTKGYLCYFPFMRKAVCRAKNYS